MYSLIYFGKKNIFTPLVDIQAHYATKVNGDASSIFMFPCKARSTHEVAHLQGGKNPNLTHVYSRRLIIIRTEN